MIRAVAALAILLLAGGAVRAQEAAPVADLSDGRSGDIRFESRTPAGWFAMLRRASETPTAIVSGTLALPAGPGGRVPAMIIAHGSSGVTKAREFWWAEQLAEIRVASFIVDSFGPRGIRQTATDQGQLSNAANVTDAFVALRLLATHPRIDPARIGIMGFSRGGQVAIFSALEPYRRAAIGDAARFAVHVPLYPACNDWHLSEAVTGAPMLFLLGGRDDYTPAQPCRDYAEWFRSKGAAISVLVYPEAGHGFDSERQVASFPNVVTGKNCGGAFDLDRFRISDRRTGEDITRTVRAYYANCVTRGASVGGNPEARRRAPQDVQGFLRSAFRL